MKNSASILFGCIYCGAGALAVGKNDTEPELFIKMLQSSIGALIKYVETDNG